MSIVGPGGQPVTSPPDKVAIDQYAERAPKLGEHLHICDGERCGLLIAAHVNPNQTVDGVALQPNGWAPVRAVDRMDQPQLIVNIPPLVTWHWGPLCPWKR